MQGELVNVNETVNEDEKEITFIDMLKVIYRHRFLIIKITGFCFVMSIILALSSTRIYRSEVTFMSDGSSKTSSIAGLIDSPLASIAGIGGSGSGNIDYTLILKSRTFHETVMRKHNLYQLYIDEKKIKLNKLDEKSKPTIQTILKWLSEIVIVSSDKKTGVYRIAVEYKNPRIAAKLANMYYDELDTYLKEKILTKSKRTRKYLEKQIDLVNEKINIQEEEYKNIEKKYKSPSVADEAKAMGDMIGNLKTNILELNAKLTVAKDFAGTENIEYKKSKRELEVYTEQLKAIEKGDKRSDINLIPIQDIPNIKVKIQRLQREVEATASIYKILVAQFEQAKLEELKDEALITVLDNAIPAENPLKPNRKLMVIIGTIVGLLLGVYISFLIEYIKNVNWKKLREDII